jgi:hypothetical protein
MSIENTVKTLSDSLTQTILEEVKGNVKRELQHTVKEYVTSLDISSIVNDAIGAHINAWLENHQDWLTKTVNPIVDLVRRDASAEILKQAQTDIANAIKIKTKDFDSLATKAFADNFFKQLDNFNFPDNSVPARSLNFDNGQRISGDFIEAGIIKGFNSTGIQDAASDCRVTIMDDSTVFENRLVAQGLRVVGNVELEGMISISGQVDSGSKFYSDLVESVRVTVNNGMDDNMFTRYSDKVMDRIRVEGVDVSNLQVKGKPAFEDGKLSGHIQDSNLRTVGMLKELQVQGEFFSSETLYTSKNRVGINTMEPGAALSIWDQEVEIEIGKFDAETARITTTRKQDLVIGSNRKSNIRLSPDGNTELQKLRLGTQTFASSPTPPNYAANKGDVVFNANPNLGGPLGWVCMGSSNWANFGLID